MLNQNIAITRGTGVLDEVFDFTTDSPARDIVEDDKIVFRLEDKASALLVKANDNSHGDDSQVEYDVDLDTVTVHLTQTEKNSTPDSGYIYKLYINDELAAYGNVTASGTPPAEEEDAPNAQFLNGVNFRVETASFNVERTDDIIVVNNSGSITATLFSSATPGGYSNVKKIIFIHETVNDLVVAGAGGTILTHSAKGSFVAICDPETDLWYVEGESGQYSGG